MKFIEHIYLKLNFWQFLLRGLFLFSFLEICFGILGLVISVPTNFGRLFYFYTSSFTLGIFVISVIFYPIISFTFWIKNTETILENVLDRILFSYHTQNTKNYKSTDTLQENNNLEISYSKLTLSLFAFFLLIFILIFIKNYNYQDNKSITQKQIGKKEDSPIKEQPKYSKLFNTTLLEVMRLSNNFEFHSIIDLIDNLDLTETEEREKKVLFLEKEYASANIKAIRSKEKTNVIRYFKLKKQKSKSDIASKFGMTNDEIQSLNTFLDEWSRETSKNTEFVKVKQELKIMKIEVKPNQTLFKLSLKYKIPVSTIKGLNNLKNDQINRGNKIFVFEGNE